MIQCSGISSLVFFNGGSYRVTLHFKNMQICTIKAQSHLAHIYCITDTHIHYVLFGAGMCNAKRVTKSPLNIYLQRPCSLVIGQCEY